MQFLSSGPDDPNKDLNQELLSSRELAVPGAQRGCRTSWWIRCRTRAGRMNIDPERLLRKYWMLLAALMILGAGSRIRFGGVKRPAVSQPAVGGSSERPTNLLPKNGGGGDSTMTNMRANHSNADQHPAQWQLSAERRRTDAVRHRCPGRLPGRDIFSRLRQRIHPATQDPLEAPGTGINVAMATFDARPVQQAPG